MQPYKGARDFYPEDKRIQDYMFNTIRRVVKSYGYSEYDAPILEPLDLYRAKTGEEIVNEQVYAFTDRGDREVAIRPEMTPTVSRMVAARRQELAYPVRWFSIPNLWRYERPQRGRLREHWQLNVDIFGEAGLAADHEIIAVADSVLKGFGATSEMYQFKINSRELVNTMVYEYFGMTEENGHTLIKLIDRMHKMDAEKFQAAISELHDTPNQILQLLNVKSLNDLPAELATHDSVSDMKQLLDLLENTGVANVAFDITLMRGFDYYTDIVFEAYDTDPDNNRSMFGGGRYNGLVALFGVEPVPTAGFGMGDVTLANFLASHDLLPELHVETDVVILTIGDVYEGVSLLATDIRAAGGNVAVDATDRKLDKKIRSADKQGVRYVLIVGESELSSGQYQVKDLQTGESETLSRDQVLGAVTRTT